MFCAFLWGAFFSVLKAKHITGLAKRDMKQNWDPFCRADAAVSIFIPTHLVRTNLWPLWFWVFCFSALYQAVPPAWEKIRVPFF